MRTTSTCLLIWLAAACGSSTPTKPPDGSTPPDGTGDAPVTIAITTDGPLLLAVFREGVDGPWRPATMKTATSYELAVHGPYVLAVVYDEGDASAHSYFTDFYAQTPVDDHVLSITTNYATTPGSTVTGTVVQPGRAYLDFDISSSTMASWALSLNAAPGPHDLFVFTADHAYAHHAVDATHDVALGTIDVNAQGAPLTTVAFTAINKTATEVLTSRAAIETPTTRFATVSRLADAAATKVVPDSLLVATERQSVSVFATDGNHSRTHRQPYHAGSSTAYTLPSLLGTASWTSAPDLTAHWTTVASVGSFYLGAWSTALPLTGYDLYATSSFLEATHLGQFTFDTTLPGYQAAWKLDTTQGYQRTISAGRAPATSTVDTDNYDEEINAPPAVRSRELRLPRGAVQP